MINSMQNSPAEHLGSWQGLQLCPQSSSDYLKKILTGVDPSSSINGYVNALMKHGNFSVDTEEYGPHPNVCKTLREYIGTRQTVLVTLLSQERPPRTQRIYIIANSAGKVIGLEERNFYYPQ